MEFVTSEALFRWKWQIFIVRLNGIVNSQFECDVLRVCVCICVVFIEKQLNETCIRLRKDVDDKFGEKK